MGPMIAGPLVCCPACGRCIPLAAGAAAQSSGRATRKPATFSREVFG